LVSVSVSHSLVSVLALVSLCSGLINKPDLSPLIALSLRLRPAQPSRIAPM